MFRHGEKQCVRYAASLLFAVLAALGAAGCKTVVEPDRIVPVLSSLSVINTMSAEASSATARFASSKAGTYTMVVFPAEADAPATAAALEAAYSGAEIKASGSAAAGANAVDLSGLSEGTAYRAHLFVRDQRGNRSTVASTAAFTPTPLLPDYYPLAAPVSGAENGVTPELTFMVEGEVVTEAAPNAAVSAALAFSGAADLAARYRIGLDSEGQAALIWSGGEEEQTVAAGGSLTGVTYTFTMPASAVDDLHLTFTFDPFPVLSAPSVVPDGTDVRLSFTSNETGVWYYLILPPSEDAPGADMVKAQALSETAGAAAAWGSGPASIGKNTVTVTGLTPGGQYNGYVVVEDSGGNLSSVTALDVNPALLYTITLDLSGGDRTNNADVVLQRQPGKVTLPNIPATGPSGRLSPKGWTTQPGMKGAYYAEGADFNLTENVILYAVWSGDGLEAGHEIAVTTLSEMPANDDPVSLSKHYILANDIGPLSEPIGRSAPITDHGGLSSDANTDFAGTFNGNGHTVKVNITGAYYWAGLFGFLAGTVRNLRVTGQVTTDVTDMDDAYCCAGGVAGWAGSFSKIENILSEVNVSARADGPACAGGVAGYVYTGTAEESQYMRFCLATGTVYAQTSHEKLEEDALGTPDGPSEFAYVQAWLNCIAYAAAGGIVGFVQQQEGEIHPVIQNCVALNASVGGSFGNDTSGSLPFVQRITGIGPRFPHMGDVHNNYADFDLPYVAWVPEGVEGSLEHYDGHGDDTPVPLSEGFFTTPGNWQVSGYPVAWDFTETWEWDSTNSRPKLKGQLGVAINDPGGEEVTGMGG
jgi:chitodextrinase